MRSWCNEYALILGFQALVMAAASAHPWLSDSLGYVRYAWDLAEGRYAPWPLTNHYSLMIGLLMPMAACFKVFGYSPAAALLFPMLCALLMTYWAMRAAEALFDRTVAWITGLLVAATPFTGLFGTQVMGDVPLGACAALALLLWARGRPFGLGLTLGYAIWLKTTGLFLAPFYFGALAWRRRWKELIRVSAGLGLMGSIYAAFFLVQADDPLHPLKVTQATVRATIAGYGLAPDWNQLLDDVLTDLPAAMFWLPDWQSRQFGLLFWAALLGGLWLRSRNAPGPWRMVTALALVTFLILDLWPLTMGPERIELWHQARFLSIILVPTAILAAAALAHRPRWAVMLAALQLSILLPVSWKQRLRVEPLAEAAGYLERIGARLIETDEVTAIQLEILLGPGRRIHWTPQHPSAEFLVYHEVNASEDRTWNKLKPPDLSRWEPVSKSTADEPLPWKELLEAISDGSWGKRTYRVVVYRRR